MARGDYWQNVYLTRPPDEVGWYEPDPIVSRRLVAEAVRRGAPSVIDVGGGASSLVDHLLDLDIPCIAVLDVSEAGMDVSRRRLGDRLRRVEWIVGDVTSLSDLGEFDVWHDRAVFHFLVEAEDRAAYVRLAQWTLGLGGTLLIATFALDGPERCSGLPVCRYDATSSLTPWGQPSASTPPSSTPIQGHAASTSSSPTRPSRASARLRQPSCHRGRSSLVAMTDALEAAWGEVHDAPA